jgi:FkbM family methyltransferase
MNKKVFIDGGARVGESLQNYLSTRPDLTGCDVYLFECNSDHYDTLNELKSTTVDYNIIVKKEAIWNSEGESDFYISNDVWGDLGCTLDQSKAESLDKDNPRKVKTIEFSKFLDQFDDTDYIIVKLDIEGAEYEVIENLIETGGILKIKELYVEWHDIFYPHKSFGHLRYKLTEYADKLKIDTWNF